MISSFDYAPRRDSALRSGCTLRLGRFASSLRMYPSILRLCALLIELLRSAQDVGCFFSSRSPKRARHPEGALCASIRLAGDRRICYIGLPRQLSKRESDPSLYAQDVFRFLSVSALCLLLIAYSSCLTSSHLSPAPK